jgi:hypothetical protein
MLTKNKKLFFSIFVIFLLLAGMFLVTTQYANASCASDWGKCRMEAMQDYSGISLALHLTACDIGRFKCEMKL